jgi:hypothetical protein
MTRIENYMNDGANWQAQAVLAYVREHISEIDYEDFTARVGRYENCREQGYVLSIRVETNERHYAVYQHRNSDSLIVLISNGMCMDTPDVNFMWKDKGENATKYDYDKGFPYGEIVKCGEWILDDILCWMEELI